MREQGLEEDHLPDHRQRKQPRHTVPQRIAEDRGGDRHRDRDARELRPSSGGVTNRFQRDRLPRDADGIISRSPAADRAIESEPIHRRKRKFFNTIRTFRRSAEERNRPKLLFIQPAIE